MIDQSEFDNIASGIIPCFTGRYAARNALGETLDAWSIHTGSNYPQKGERETSIREIFDPYRLLC